MKKKLLAAAVVLTAVLMLGGCEGLSAKNAKGPETEESCLYITKDGNLQWVSVETYEGGSYSKEELLDFASEKIKEYNEANGINAERITTTDGDGKVIKDTVSFVKNGYWYTIDYLNKNYDRVPELPGMSMPFAETLISWFNVRPQGGNDAVTGYDYDKMTKGTNSLNFYYAKDTADWKGYEVSYLPIFKVLEVSNTVDEATAFALPPADFKAVANPSMRAYANRLLDRQ